jgi:hypothetical protein
MFRASPNFKALLFAFAAIIAFNTTPAQAAAASSTPSIATQLDTATGTVLRTIAQGTVFAALGYSAYQLAHALKYCLCKAENGSDEQEVLALERNKSLTKAAAGVGVATAAYAIPKMPVIGIVDWGQPIAAIITGLFNVFSKK